MSKHATKVKYEELSFLNYNVTDVFSGWERALDCFHEVVKLIQSTGTTEQIAEMTNILSKYDINLKEDN